MSALYIGALYNNHIKENYVRFEILAAMTVNPAYSECDTVQLCGEAQKVPMRQTFHLKIGGGTANKYIIQE